ncbi:hypothetical protein ACWCOW_37915 [Streptomyces sp. NPDC001939]
MALLCDLGLVIRPEGGERKGNSYRLHPLAAKYQSHDDLVKAFRQAVAEIKAGTLPSLSLPRYTVAPPAEGTGRNLQVA